MLSAVCPFIVCYLLSFSPACVKVKVVYKYNSVTNLVTSINVKMVGFNERALDRLSSTEFAIAGGVAGSVTRAITQPLDVLKIRFQLQVEPIERHPNNKYWGIFQATGTIIRQEGLGALWKGHVPAQILSITYGLVQVAIFEKLTEKAWYHLPHLQGDLYRPLVHFGCATLAGTAACVASFPFDVVRTRLVAQGNFKVYKGVYDGLYQIIATSGFRGLYIGLLPTILQTAPYAGTQFGLYALLNSLYQASQGDREEFEGESHENSWLIGAIAGMGAKTVVYPMDLAKKRMQMRGFERSRVEFGEPFTCSGFIHCIVKTKRTEGFRAMYKGFWPSLIKAAVTSSLYFSIYVYTCAALTRLKEIVD